MVLLGTLVNMAAVTLGTLVGLFFKKGLKENIIEMSNHALGLAVLFIGMGTSLKGLLNPESSPLLFIVSIVLGGVIGEILKVETHLERVGERLKCRMGDHHGPVAEGFVTATLIYCVGSMSILGSLQSGLEGTHEILYAKSILDCVCSVILASTLGIGVIFSVIPILIYQGSLALLASVIGPHVTTEVIRELSTVGGILIFVIGINLLEIKKIRTGNLLPALAIPPIWILIEQFLPFTG